MNLSVTVVYYKPNNLAMKCIILINLLIISSLSLVAQNLNNVAIYNNNIGNQQAMINDNPYGNVSIQAQTNRGGGNVLRNVNMTASNNRNQSNPNKQINRVQQNNLGNVFDNNINVRDNNIGTVQVNPNNKVSVNDVNFRVNNVVIPQVNTGRSNGSHSTSGTSTKTTQHKTSKSSGNNSGGVKFKKQTKNFYTPHNTKSKIKPKRKPSFAKVKHHTSKCAKW